MSEAATLGASATREWNIAQNRPYVSCVLSDCGRAAEPLVTAAREGELHRDPVSRSNISMHYMYILSEHVIRYFKLYLITGDRIGRRQKTHGAATLNDEQVPRELNLR